MAKYDITYACGHSNTVQLYGPTNDRKRKIEWMERECLCSECYKIAREKEKKDAAQAAAISNFETGCEELNGSEAQVAWAETIRSAHLAAIDNLREKAAKVLSTGDERPRKLLDFSVKTQLWLKGINSAKWWIDNQAGASDTAKFLSMMDIRGRRPVANEDQMARRMFCLSPHMTEELAKSTGLESEWRAAAQQAAEAKVVEEDAQKGREIAEKARALGWKGSVKPWHKDRSDGRNLRLYFGDMPGACVRWIKGKFEETVVFEGLEDTPESREVAVTVWAWCNGNPRENKMRNLYL